jgi:hypothetical protein
VPQRHVSSYLLIGATVTSGAAIIALPAPSRKRRTQVRRSRRRRPRPPITRPPAHAPPATTAFIATATSAFTQSSPSTSPTTAGEAQQDSTSTVDFGAFDRKLARFDTSPSSSSTAPTGSSQTSAGPLPTSVMRPTCRRLRHPRILRTRPRPTRPIRNRTRPRATSPSESNPVGQPVGIRQQSGAAEREIKLPNAAQQNDNGRTPPSAC